MKVTAGSFGQFDVLVDGSVVVSKTGSGIFLRLLGRGEFPNEDEAVAAVKTRLEAG